jgi:hypothetical protein
MQIKKTGSLIVLPKVNMHSYRAGALKRSSTAMGHNNYINNYAPPSKQQHTANQAPSRRPIGVWVLRCAYVLFYVCVNVVWCLYIYVYVWCVRVLKCVRILPAVRWNYWVMYKQPLALITRPKI